MAVRGLIRREAAQQAGLIRGDEFRGLSEIFVWLAKVLRWGSFIRVPEPLYYRLDHAGNYHKQWFDWPKKRKRAAWTTLFTGLLEATMPVCTTPEERLFFQQFILDRIVVVRPGQSYHYKPNSPQKPPEHSLPSAWSGSRARGTCIFWESRTCQRSFRHRREYKLCVPTTLGSGQRTRN